MWLRRYQISLVHVFSILAESLARSFSFELHTCSCHCRVPFKFQPNIFFLLLLFIFIEFEWEYCKYCIWIIHRNHRVLIGRPGHSLKEIVEGKLWCMS